jgi:hypothetical protein
LAVGQADLHASLPDGQPNISHFSSYLLNWTSKNLFWATSFNLVFAQYTGGSKR